VNRTGKIFDLSAARIPQYYYSRSTIEGDTLYLITWIVIQLGIPADLTIVFPCMLENYSLMLVLLHPLAQRVVQTRQKPPG